jgi:hypothetical protein
MEGLGETGVKMEGTDWRETGLRVKTKRRHSKHREPVEDRTCTSCNRILSSSKRRKYHMKVNKCQAVCRVCGEYFKGKSKRGHFVHRWVQCEDCGKTYRNFSRSAHIKSQVHRGQLVGKPLSQRTESGLKSAVGRIVAQFNEATAEAGEEVRRICWQRIVDSNAELFKEEVDPLSGEDMDVMRREAKLTEESMQRVMQEFRRKWGNVIVPDEVR